LVSVVGGPPGGKASVTAQTTPGAVCAIWYVAPLGAPSQAPGLVTTAADAAGRANWSWAIGAATRPGVGQVTVTCNGAGASSPIQIG
jgi:hypothetical protein